MVNANIVPLSDWGKDHWSLLAYLYHLVTNPVPGQVFDGRSVGVIDYRRLRVNESTHPLHNAAFMAFGWKSGYGTRLRGYFVLNEDGSFKKKNGQYVVDTSRQLPDHDDIDCLNDLEAAGVAEWVSAANGFVVLTDYGLRLANALMDQKARGGLLAGFLPGDDLLTPVGGVGVMNENALMRIADGVSRLEVVVRDTKESDKYAVMEFFPVERRYEETPWGKFQTVEEASSYVTGVMATARTLLSPAA